MLFYGAKAHCAFLFTLVLTKGPSAGPNNAAQVHATNQAQNRPLLNGRAQSRQGPNVGFFFCWPASLSCRPLVSSRQLTALLSSLMSLHGIPLPCTKHEPWSPSISAATHADLEPSGCFYAQPDVVFSAWFLLSPGLEIALEPHH